MRGVENQGAMVLLAVLAVLSRPALFLNEQQSSPDQSPTSPREAQQSRPTQPPSPPPLTRSPLRFALPRREYLCADGVRIVVLVEPNAVRLTLNDRVHNLMQVSSDSGTEYSDGSLVWSANGPEAALKDKSDPANPKMLAEGCKLESAFPPIGSQLRSIKGTVTFGKHPSLPDACLLHIELRNLSLPANDSAALLADLSVPLKDRSSPIPFELTFDPSKVSAGSRIGVLATIASGDKLLFRSLKPTTIPDLANPGPVSVALSPLSHSKPHSSSSPAPQTPPER